MNIFKDTAGDLSGIIRFALKGDIFELDIRKSRKVVRAGAKIELAAVVMQFKCIGPILAGAADIRVVFRLVGSVIRTTGRIDRQVGTRAGAGQ